MTDGAVHYYVDFFASRLGDFPSLPGSLLALRALLQHHGAAALQVYIKKLCACRFVCSGLEQLINRLINAMRTQTKHHTPTLTPLNVQEAPAIARALFKDVHVPSMTQGVRQRAFEVLLELVSPSSTAMEGGYREQAAAVLQPLLGMGADFLRCVSVFVP